MNELLMVLGIITVIGLQIWALNRRRENSLLPTELQEHIIRLRDKEDVVKQLRIAADLEKEKYEKLKKGYDLDFRSTDDSGNDNK